MKNKIVKEEKIKELLKKEEAEVIIHSSPLKDYDKDSLLQGVEKIVPESAKFLDKFVDEERKKKTDTGFPEVQTSDKINKTLRDLAPTINKGLSVDPSLNKQGKPATSGWITINEKHIEFKEKPLVTILSVVLDNFKYFRDCYQTTEKNTRVSHVWKVNDLGDDGTSYFCKEKGIPVFKNELPSYYSQSNNFLAKDIDTKYILFMNPDTLPAKNFIEELLKEMEDKKVAIVGSRLMYPNGTIQHSGTYWDEQMEVPDDRGYLQRMSPEWFVSRNVDGISGACFIIRTKVFKELGGFDEKFKNGYEDLDLCLKAKKKGYKVRWCGRSEVTHYRGTTQGTRGDITTALEFLDDNVTYLKKKWRKPNKTYTSKLYINRGQWQSKVLIGSPMTGNVRVEWFLARTGAIIPTNWSNATATPILPTSAPLQYLVPDAQNIIVRDALVGKYNWLLLIERDNLIPPDFYIKMNEYMRKEDVPVVSGLYFTKSEPPEPMVYTRDGWSFDRNWKMGDKVETIAVPTGAVLIHCSILQKMWDASPEYLLWGNVVRRVFEAPAKVWYDPQLGPQMAAGTSDLFWSSRVIKERFFEKAGWSDYQKKKRPFIVDTGIFVTHITDDGVKYPLNIPEEFLRK